MREFNILMVGVGGQGVVLVSDVLSEAALRAGLDVKKSEIHGMSQRGGPVFSHVRIGDLVHSPTIPQGEADVLYSLERMELIRWSQWARPDASCCYVANDILPEGVGTYPTGIDEEIERIYRTRVRIDQKALRGKVSPKVINTTLLGCLSTLIPEDLLTAEHIVAAMPGMVPAGTEDVNAAAFALGRELAAAQLAPA